MMFQRMMGLGVLTAATISGVGVTAQAAEKRDYYASDRSPTKFLGDTQIILQKFDPANEARNTAALVLDKNDVTFGSFGDMTTTTVFFKPFDVKLTRLRLKDPSDQGRSIYDVELPNEQAKELGKNMLRLVFPSAQDRKDTIRLLLVDPNAKVIQTLELKRSTKGA